MPFAVTLELPWKDNQQFISCIPKGSYVVDRIPVDGGKIVFKLRDVPGRTGIDIHIGNTVKDLKGCIAVGENFNDWGDLTALGQSAAGMKELEARSVGLKQFRLTILEQESMIF